MQGLPAPREAGATRWRWVAALAVILVAVACFAPALRAWFVLDDYTLLAEARLLRQPFGAFVHDHFPGSLFFRPLGIAVWWLATALFDNAPRGHYVVNLLLHLSCVAALYALLQRLRRDAAVNLAWTAAFAVHPLAIGTALWLSDRFDLIATLFTLLAVNLALRYRRDPHGRYLAGACVCVLVAFAGKEIAIVGAVAIAALWFVPDADSRLDLRRRLVAAAAVGGVTVAWLGWRHALMTNPQDVLLLPGEMVATFVRGIGLWLRIGFEFLALDPRLPPVLRLAIGLATLPLIVALVAALRRRDWRRSAWGVGAALFVLILLPGPTQAPVVAFSTADLDAHTFWFNLIGESRLYHLSLAGLVCASMLLTSPGRNDRVGATPTRLAFAGLVPLVALWAFAAHGIAHDFARRTREQIAPLRAAHAAIAALPLPDRRCQIYLLGTDSLWGFDGLADPLIKGSAPAALGRRLQHCLIMTDRTAWGTFVRAGAIGPEDWRPMHPLTFRGKPVPWLELDGFEAAYLDLEPDIDARTIDGAFFLEYRDGAFVDVGAAVRDGSRPLRFRNVRPDRG